MHIVGISNPENERSKKELKKKKKLKEEADSSAIDKKQYADDNVEEEKKKKKKKRKNIKIFDLPGQKRDPPDERDPLRIFYETLYKHSPHSEIAQIWMMESGLLSREDAEKIHKKKRSKSQQERAEEVARSGSCSKSVAVKRKKAST